MSPPDFLAVDTVASSTVLLAKISVILIVSWASHLLLRRSNPKWRILVWRVSTVGLICVVALSFSSPVFTLPLLPAVSAVSDAASPLEVTVRSAASVEGDVAPSPASAVNPARTGGLSDLLGADSVPKTASPAHATTDESTEAAESPASARRSSTLVWDPLTWLLLFWIVGVVLGLLRLLVGIAQVSQICHGSAAVPAWVESEMAWVARRDVKAGRVTVRQTENVTAPCSAGLLQNTILLPSGMCVENRASEVRAILAHEAAHLTGHDLGWNLVLQVLAVLLWFHPLAWRIRLAHADACDERCDAVAANCLQDADGYGRLLAKIALELSGRTLTTALPMARVSHVGRRIEMIKRGVGNRGIRLWKTRTAAIVAVTVLVCLATVGVSRSTSQATAEIQSVADDRTVDAQEPQQEAKPLASGEIAEETSSVASASSDKIQPVPLFVDVPKLVAVWPANQAENVDPNNELHLRFDRPVDPLSFQLEWRQGSYLECGNSRYLEDTNQLVIPVRLEADRKHKIIINSPTAMPGTPGFVSRDGSAVSTAAWEFQTRANEQSSGALPKVVSIHPPLDSEVARVVWVRIRFDQAMDPLAYSFLNRWPSMEPAVLVNSAISYDEKNNEFLFPIVLPSEGTGELELSGLRSRNGTEAQPITLRYSPGGDVFDQEELNRLLRPDSLAKLQDLIDHVGRARGELQSVSATVHSVSYGSGALRRRGFSRLDGHWSRFKMQGDRRFFADISQVMGIPFQVGSDGEECWLYSQRPDENGQRVPTLISGGYEDIQEKRLSFVDPFDFDGRELDEVVKQRRLEYLGPARIDETDCHLVQSVTAHDVGFGDGILLMVKRWWIATETFHPLQVTTDYSGRTVDRFYYDSINQKLPVAEFQPRIEPQTVRRKLGPLAEGYDKRFIRISDGTNGRMSCRWGQSGTKGTAGSGLN